MIEFSLNFADSSSSSQLRQAITEGNPSQILPLLREGADVNYYDDSVRGRTLLHIALGANDDPVNLDVVQVLLVCVIPTAFGAVFFTLLFE